MDKILKLREKSVVSQYDFLFAPHVMLYRQDANVSSQTASKNPVNPVPFTAIL